MPRKDRITRGNRALLNLPGHQSTAAIVAEFSYDPDGSYDSWDRTFELKISDCTRTIDLYVSVDTDGEYRNSLYKLDTMIHALRELRKLVVKEGNRAAKQREQAD